MNYICLILAMTFCFVNKSAGVFPVSNNFSFYFHICFLERTDDGPVGIVLYIIYFSGTDDGRRTRCYRLIYVFCAPPALAPSLVERSIITGSITQNASSSVQVKKRRRSGLR